MIGCYLLHFDPPYRHAGHYLGWSSDVDARVATHLAGKGARLVQVALAAGSTVRLVRLWRGALRRDESRMKQRKGPRGPGARRGARGSLTDLCPVCAPGAGLGRWPEATVIGKHRARPGSSGRCRERVDGVPCRRRVVLVRATVRRPYLAHLPTPRRAIV